MTNKLAWLALACLLCAGGSLAQSRGGRNGIGGGTSGASAVNEEGTVSVLAALLNLNNPQQQQLQKILDDALASAKPIQDRLNGGKQSLFAAAQAADSDEQIDKLAGQQGALYAQNQALQARTFSKICKLLTKDQKAQINPTLYDMLETFLTIQPPEPGQTGKPGGETPPN